MVEAVVIFSGGPDSTAAALWAIESGYEVELLTMQFRPESQYGEIKSAIQIASALGLKHTIFDFKSPMSHFSSDVHILMHSGGTNNGNLRLPFGAGAVLATAANYALYHGKSVLIWGATKDDGEGAYEYTNDFSKKFAQLVSDGAGVPFEIHTPLSEQHKHSIVDKYFQRRSDLFAQTWSCKAARQEQCGECHSCIARRMACKLSKSPDTTAYTQLEVKWPMDEATIASPDTISPDTLAKIFQSEDPTKPGGG